MQRNFRKRNLFLIWKLRKYLDLDRDEDTVTRIGK